MSRMRFDPNIPYRLVKECIFFSPDDLNQHMVPVGTIVMMEVYTNDSGVFYEPGRVAHVREGQYKGYVRLCNSDEVCALSPLEQLAWSVK